MHLFERDCSLQRRHQKVIEEAPAPGMDAATREAVCASAVRAAQAVGYEGAGTVEFIADASDGLRADRIWFMEMNTRLQVEHPVTEAITGQDLVDWQLRVASGEPLPRRQDELSIKGWAMEARLYAENPASGFLPSTGRLEHFRLPSDIRVDSAVEQGSEVTSFYDPMIAKLIAHADTREAAAAKLAQACREVEVWPVKTNAAFLACCLAEPDFVAGRVDTGFIGARQEVLTAPEPTHDAAVVGAAMMAGSRVGRPLPSPREVSLLSPWDAVGGELFGFRLNRMSGAVFSLLVDDKPMAPLVRRQECGFAVELEGQLENVSFTDWRSARGRFPPALVEGRSAPTSYILQPDGVVVFSGGSPVTVSLLAAAEAEETSTADGAITSPMPGRVVSVHVAVGERVAKGQTLLAVEAMKMEHSLTAPFDGVVAELNAAPGQQVGEGATLVRLDPGGGA